jgi:hypothetical protein
MNTVRATIEAIRELTRPFDPDNSDLVQYLRSSRDEGQKIRRVVRSNWHDQESLEILDHGKLRGRRDR